MIIDFVLEALGEMLDYSTNAQRGKEVASAHDPRKRILAPQLNPQFYADNLQGIVGTNNDNFLAFSSDQIWSGCPQSDWTMDGMPWGNCMVSYFELPLNGMPKLGLGNQAMGLCSMTDYL